MDNETTMPGLLTGPSALDAPQTDRPLPGLYKLLLLAFVLGLAGLACYFI